MPDSKFLDKRNLVDILDSLEVGVVYVDHENRFAFVNSAGEEIRGICSEERLGTSILQCHSERIHGKVLDDLKAFHSGEYATRHKMIKSKGRYFDNNYSVVKDDEGNFKGVVLVSQDVTEKVELEKELKKANEELEKKIKERTIEIKTAYEKLKMAQRQLMQSEKMAAIGQFVSGVAHEINNPLDGIQNCIRMVLGDLDNKQQAEEYLPLAMEGLFKIEVLVRRLLDYAKPHSDEKVKVNIHDVIDDAIELTKFKLKKKGVAIQKRYNHEPLFIYGETHYLSQVFVNLILNSFDAMEQEGFITIETYLENNKNVKINVKDNGVGVSEKDQAKVFNPFFTTKQKNNGTGLGLYLAYNVISEHAGKIEFNSKLDEGSEITIMLPFFNEENLIVKQETESLELEK
ncbi:MAG: PAS domain S-box protein [Ignavibacteriales bacterium]|jgi:PAS domain S-box-containing protein|nr:ATP-binding protein [Melioribacteraceae bacterium]RJP59941.1 MAG: PAS domain S-box protein [Ignavibacteriales bacterium]